MRLEAKVVFTPTDLARRLLQAEEIVAEEMGAALDDLAGQVERGAKRKAPKDRGDLSRKITIGKPAPAVRTIGANVPQAAPMEYGTRPHWPPVTPIREWVWRNRAKFGVSTRPQAERVAFMVGRAIARRGLKERRYLRASLAQVIQGARETVMLYARRLVKRVMGS